MTVSEIAAALDARALTMPDPDREVTGGYCGDLLSWVMGRAQSGDLWMTIMSNVNTIAVASLSDVSAVLLAEGVTLDPDLIKTAEEKDVNVLSTDLPAYEAAVRLGELLNRQRAE